MVSNVTRRSVAVALTAAVVSLYTAVPVSGAELSSFRGRVITADGTTPREGVIITLVDVAGERTYDSMPTDEAGAFRLDSAPAGSYRLVARAPEGAFVASGELKLQAGENPPLALALRPLADEGEEGGGDKLPLSAEEEARSKWVKGVLAGTVILSGFAAYEILNDSENNTSPSSF